MVTDIREPCVEIEKIAKIKTRYLKTYAANVYAHHSHAWKQVKLTGTCLSTKTGGPDP